MSQIWVQCTHHSAVPRVLKNATALKQTATPTWDVPLLKDSRSQGVSEERGGGGRAVASELSANSRSQLIPDQLPHHPVNT